NDLKLYVYPLLDQKTDRLFTVDSLEVAPGLRKLYGYLVQRGCITPLDNHHAEYLKIFSRDVLARIKRGDASWETMVPPGVATVIKEKHFFEYQPPEIDLAAEALDGIAKDRGDVNGLPSRSGV
ncbi:MAG TPA: hypothetical protein VGR62_00935, partial [Candidatus Binatia bacterium]|nr:hypothetical protein [Candidatus Binatia bacterium]